MDLYDFLSQILPYLVWFGIIATILGFITKIEVAITGIISLCMSALIFGIISLRNGSVGPGIFALLGCIVIIWLAAAMASKNTKPGGQHGISN